MKTPLSLLFLSLISTTLAASDPRCFSDPATPRCEDGAPGDCRWVSCRNGMNHQFHVFPENYRILLDSYDYEVLYSIPGIPSPNPLATWLNADFDGDGLSWLPGIFGGPCTWQLYSNKRSSQPLDNWLFTQYVCLHSVQEIIVEVDYRFSDYHGHVTLNYFGVNGPLPDEVRGDPDNYTPFLTLVPDRSHPGQRKEIYRLSRPPTNGTYIGIQETGINGFVTRVLVYFKVCPAKRVGLVIYPEHPLPPVGGPNSVFKARCVDNARPLDTLDVIAPGNGEECVDVAFGGAACECGLGYVEVSGVDGQLHCMPCPAGTYRNRGDDSCKPCPANTRTDEVGVDGCDCLEGFFRDDQPEFLEGPGFDCTAPPVAPVGLAVVDGTETQDSLTIRWDCPESNGREDTFFMVCHTTVDTSPQCSEVTPVSCEDPVVHTITGLDPVTSYMIDVSTHDGITDQDPDNDLLRISRTSGSTAEGVPGVPTFKRLCTVLIWKEPETFTGDIMSYEVCLGSCVHDEFVCRNMSVKEDNFLLTSTDEKRANIDARIRANNKRFRGEWSDCSTIACEDFIECTGAPPIATASPSPPPASTLPPASTTPPPASTLPPASTTPPPASTPASTPPPASTTPSPPSVSTTSNLPACDAGPIYFELKGTTIEPGSTIDLNEIGEEGDALCCHTPERVCCRGQKTGEFLYPSGNKVGIKNDGGELYRNRGNSYICLHHRHNGAGVMSGQYQCCVPDGCDNDVCVPINLVGS